MSAPLRRLVAGSLLSPTGWLHDVAITVADGRIESIAPAEAGSADVDVLVPGFVDLQVNGVDDVDIWRADGDDWSKLDSLLLAQGVTSWCPTLITARLEAYAVPLARITSAASDPGRRTRIVGAHLEGPFLGAAHGAHRPDLVVPVDLDWLAALPPIVTLVTLGPEQHESSAAIRLLTARGVRVSIGHSRADDAALDAAVEAGATLVTHLYNGMSGLHHREPGVAAWALTHHRVAASLIADGVHVHPRMLQLAATVLGHDRMVLVTDAVAWNARRAGSVSDLEVRDGAPRRPDGTLAGSMLTMDAAVRTAVSAGITLEHACRAASTVPARLMGLEDRGELTPGRLADLVALDDGLQVVDTWVGGLPT